MTGAPTRLGRIVGRDDGAAAIEACILLPLFLTMVLGVVDLATATFEAMQVNAAAQAGMAAGVIDPTLAGVQSAMNAAAGGLTLDTALTGGTISNGVITITATCDTGSHGACAPILPWPMNGTFVTSVFPLHLTSTATVRVR